MPVNCSSYRFLGAANGKLLSVEQIESAANCKTSNMIDLQKQLVEKQLEIPVCKPYQVCDDIIALFLQPNQNTGCVQSTTVGQNHGIFRHDEGRLVQQVMRLWSGSREGTARK